MRLFFRRIAIVVVVSVLAISARTTYAAVEVVDLNVWTDESYEGVSGFPDGLWTVNVDGSVPEWSADDILQ